MANLDEDIKRITDEIMQDGTIEKILREKVEKGFSDAIDSAFRAVGDTVYYTDNEYYFAVLPVKIEQIIIGDLTNFLYQGFVFSGNNVVETQFDFSNDDFDKTVFFTQKQAEEALQALKKTEDGK